MPTFGKRRALTSPISASGGRLVSAAAFGLSKCRHIRNTWQRCNIDFVPSAPSHLTTDAPPESVLTEEPTGNGAEKGGFCGADGAGAGAGAGLGAGAGGGGGGCGVGMIG